MPSAERRRIWDLSLSLGALVAAVLAVVTIVWINIDRIDAAAHKDNDAREALAWADTALDATNDQANALDDLLKSQDPRFILPYQQGRQRLNHALERLSALASDAPLDQRREMDEVVRLAGIWTHQVAEPRIAEAQAGRQLALDASMGEREMAGIEQAVDRLHAGETLLLRERDRALHDAYVTSREALVVGSGFALAFAMLIFGRVTAHLIADRRRAEAAAESLSQALHAAQAAERAKTRFLANMSHEMRTPLNGVVGMTETLARGALEPSQRELLEAIRFSSVALDHLFGDLLSLSRSDDSEPVEHQAAPFNLKAAVRVTARPFVELAEAKGLKFVIDGADAIDVDVTSYAGPLGQLLSCLLSNAVKFTDRGHVTLGVSRSQDDIYRFDVADTGVGFDEARQSELFETFGQSDDSDTRRGGAGLGLALARRLADEFKGTLEARSTPGVGSVFTFTAKLATTERVETIPAGTAAVGEQPQVMIVDDNPTNRKVLELVLDHVGVAWVSVEDGKQAVEAARERAFAAILMDIQMPVMDGITATREIRRFEREMGRPQAPVIIVSANCQPQHVEAGITAGAQLHLAKPVSVQALIDALNDVMPESPETEDLQA